MSITGSLKSLLEGKTTGFIGYPREYILGDTPEKSFIKGVDQNGESFTLSLTIPGHFIEAAKVKTDISIPDVASLAETHRKARNPCFSSPDNGPENITGGIFVAEQARVLDKNAGTYTANWLSILKEDEDSPEHKSGIGYLEINAKNPSTPEFEERKIRLEKMNAAYNDTLSKNPDAESILGMSLLDFSQERDGLALDIYEMQQKWFIGVVVQYDKIAPLNLDDMEASKKSVVDSLSSNSVSGMYGGVILRPIKVEGGERTVIVDSIRKINHQYDYKLRAVPTTESAWDTFMQKGGTGWVKAMRSKGYEIEIIPCQRVNCGKVSNEKYGKEFGRGFSKQLKAFVDSKFHHSPYVNFSMQNAFIATPIAMRNAETRRAEFNSNILLSSIHSIGKAIGNVLEIDKNGERTLKLSQPIAPSLSQNRPGRRVSEPSFD